MTDSRPPRFADEPQGPAALGDLVDGAVRRVITAVMIAGGLIALAIWSQEGGEAPRYQVTAADGRIIRVNTESGTVIACENGHCAIILQRGQDLEEGLPERPAPRIEARPAPAAPAPAPANEAAAAAQ